VTLKSRLEVIEGHWKWRQSIDRIRVPNFLFVLQGGQLCCSSVANLLQYLCAKNYQNMICLTKLFQK